MAAVSSASSSSSAASQSVDYKACVSKYCSAARKLEAALEASKAQVEDFKTAQKAAIEYIRGRMTRDQRTCIAVLVPGSQDTVYARMITTSSVDEMTDEVVRKAVDAVTVEMLVQKRADAKEKIEKLAKKAAANGTPAPVFDIVQAWNEVIEDNARAINSKTTVSCKVGTVAERGFKIDRQPPIDHELQRAILKCHSLQQQIDDAEAKYEEDIKNYRLQKKESEADVAQYLATTRTGTQIVNLKPPVAGSSGPVGLLASSGAVPVAPGQPARPQAHQGAPVAQTPQVELKLTHRQKKPSVRITKFREIASARVQPQIFHPDCCNVASAAFERRAAMSVNADTKNRIYHALVTGIADLLRSESVKVSSVSLKSVRS